MTELYTRVDARHTNLILVSDCRLRPKARNTAPWTDATSCLKICQTLIKFEIYHMYNKMFIQTLPWKTSLQIKQEMMKEKKKDAAKKENGINYRHCGVYTGHIYNQIFIVLIIV